MARRTAEVTSQENGPAGDGNHQGIPSGAIAVPGQIPSAAPSDHRLQSRAGIVGGGFAPQTTVAFVDWTAER